MIKYNTSVEVTKKQFNAVLNNFNGIIAHRKSETLEGEIKYFIKLMIPKYAPLIQITLDENEK